MPWVVIIPVAALCLIVGFWSGVRYCVRRMLPNVIASLHPVERSRVLNEAGKIAGLDRPPEPVQRYVRGRAPNTR